jgi:radical SAM superfamily enzyme YgiQ (UPF0313 family)
VRILLVCPKNPFEINDPDFRMLWEQRLQNSLLFRQNWTGIANALIILAALTPPAIDVELVDENASDIDFSRRYDLVGITALTCQAVRAYQIADRFRQQGCAVAMGGIHVTVLPEEAQQHADAVAIGEGEYLWPQIVRDCERGCLRKVYRSDRLVDLRDVPLPRFDLLKERRPASVCIQATRGCPNDCEFCVASNIYGHKFRCKSVEQVLLEVETVQRTLGKTRVNFVDDNILGHRKFFVQLLESLTPLDIRYYLSSDISVGKDERFLDLLRTSGCVNITIGLETVYEEGLLFLDRSGFKARQLKHYRDYIDRIQSRGIGVYGAFIVGLDTDDETIFDRIADFIIETHLYEAQITIITPLPGSRLYERMKNENRLLGAPWDQYTMANLNFVHPRITKPAMEKGLFRTYQRVYSEETYLGKMAYFKGIQKRLMEAGQLPKAQV